MIPAAPPGDRPRVLVSGGAGYVGSHACRALAEAGFLPVTYDDLSRGHRSLVRYGPFEAGDIRDRQQLDAVLAAHAPIAVLHFAALAYVGESVTDPARYYAVNLAGALCLLEAIRARGIAPLVFSSTCATYGVPAIQPIVESTPQEPINPYGRSKLMVEQILRDLSAAEGVRSVSLRYFNACGAHPSGEIGEMHDPEPHLVPRAIMAARGEIEALDVFGADYPTPDGTAIRDYVHVCDLADAHVAALRYLLEGGETIALNLGTGRGHSVREIVAAVQRVSGRDVPVRLAPRRPGDPARLVADAAAAARALGFTARWTDIDRVIRTAWDWHDRQRPPGGETVTRSGDVPG